MPTPAPKVTFYLQVDHHNAERLSRSCSHGNVKILACQQNVVKYMTVLGKMGCML